MGDGIGTSFMGCTQDGGGETEEAKCCEKAEKEGADAVFFVVFFFPPKGKYAVHIWPEKIRNFLKQREFHLEIFLKVSVLR